MSSSTCINCGEDYKLYRFSTKVEDQLVIFEVCEHCIRSLLSGKELSRFKVRAARRELRKLQRYGLEHSPKAQLLRAHLVKYSQGRVEYNPNLGCNEPRYGRNGGC